MIYVNFDTGSPDDVRRISLHTYESPKFGRTLYIREQRLVGDEWRDAHSIPLSRDESAQLVSAILSAWK